MNTTTLDPPIEQQPYLVSLATRTARWTAHVTTALVAEQYVEMVTSSRLLGLTAALVAGVLTAAAGDRQRWAQWALAGIWAWWLASGMARHGLHSPLLLVEALAGIAPTVAGALALCDVARQRTR